MSVRLAICVDSHELGGAEVSVANLVDALAPEVDVTIVGEDPAVLAWFADRSLSAGRTLGTALVEPAPGLLERVPVAALVMAYRRVLREIAPDVVQVNVTAPRSGRAALAALATVYTPRVVVVEQLPTPIGRARTRLVHRALLRRVQAHVAVGQQAARLVERYQGLPVGTVRTIEQGVPERELDGIRIGRSRRPSRGVIGTLARLHEQKGIDVLLHALVELPGTTGVVVGDGPEHGALTALAERLGVADRVRFTGWSDNPQACLDGFDVFCLPSRFEGLPMSIIEAMLAGVPVVATDVGSVAEAVVDRCTGLLVEPDNPSALARALRAVLDDPALSSRLSAAGYEHARACFGTERQARSFEALYDELLVGRSARPRTSSPMRR